jgi:hypothetical protein
MLGFGALGQFPLGGGPDLQPKTLSVQQFTDLAAQPKRKAISDVFPTINALLTPNPSRPFVQALWDNPAKRRTVATSEPVLSGIRTAPVVTKPFHQDLWDAAKPAKVKALPEVFDVINPLFSPNPPRPFSQTDWDLAANPKIKAQPEAFDVSNPLFSPNPSRPFAMHDWQRVRRVTRTAKVDDVVNLMGLRGVVVVPTPFNQDLWEGAAKPRLKITDVSIGTSLPLTQFLPINQNLWENAKPPRLSQKSDAPANMLPLLAPNPAIPFNQDLWENAAFARVKARVDDFANLRPIQTVVVVVAPFNQTDWARPAALRQPIKSDIYVNLLPLHTPPVVSGPPFFQTDWTGVATPRRAARVDDVVNLLAIQNPPPIPPIPPQPPNIKMRVVRDYWDRDEWGNFIPGGGTRETL